MYVEVYKGVTNTVKSLHYKNTALRQQILRQFIAQSYTVGYSLPPTCILSFPAGSVAETVPPGDTRRVTETLSERWASESLTGIFTNTNTYKYKGQTYDMTESRITRGSLMYLGISDICPMDE